MRTLLERISFSLISLSFVSCASTHPGNLGRSTAKQDKLPMIVSAESLEFDEKSVFQLVEITIENTSQEWLRIAKANVLIDDPAKSKLSVVTGNDLIDWAKAENFKQKKDQQNKDMIQLGVLGAGTAAAVIGSGRNDAGLQTAGAAVAVGTHAYAVGDTIAAAARAAERSEKVPDNHLYHSGSVPPQMFLRRWVLINKPFGYSLSSMAIEFETVEGLKDTYVVDL